MRGARRHTRAHRPRRSRHPHPRNDDRAAQRDAKDSKTRLPLRVERMLRTKRLRQARVRSGLRIEGATLDPARLHRHAWFDRGVAPTRHVRQPRVQAAHCPEGHVRENASVHGARNRWVTRPPSWSTRPRQGYGESASRSVAFQKDLGQGAANARRERGRSRERSCWPSPMRLRRGRTQSLRDRSPRAAPPKIHGGGSSEFVLVRPRARRRVLPR